MPKLQDITGQRYGRLLVKGFSHRTASYTYYWLCSCDCGAECVVLSASLKRGNTMSCGCFQEEARSTNHRLHGMCGSRTWKSWSTMLRRCKPDAEKAKYYAERGITVCDRWRKFANFLADMGERPEGTSIDRIDNNGNYEPGNCRWATLKEQARNKRNVVMLELNGRSQCMKEWANELGLTHAAIQRRLKAGWAMEKVLSSTRFHRYGQYP